VPGAVFFKVAVGFWCTSDIQLSYFYYCNKNADNLILVHVSSESAQNMGVRREGQEPPPHLENFALPWKKVCRRPWLKA